MTSVEKEANDLFVDKLRKLKPDPDMVEIYRKILSSEYSDMTKYNQDEKTNTLNQIKVLSDRLNSARQKMFMDLIDPADFKIMKVDCEKAIEELERRLVGMSSSRLKSIDDLLQQSFENLLQLDSLYINGDVEAKRNIIGSIFPENLTFDGMNYRTERINESVRLIYLIDSNLQGKKTVQAMILSTCTVRRTGRGSARTPKLFRNTFG